MKNRIVLAMALLLSMFVPTFSHAQTRVLVGAAGAQEFDNSSVGLLVGVEIPFAKHYELDLKDTFSPFESHVALGGGRANLASVGGQIWLTSSWGIAGRVEDSSYNVTKIAKDGDYAFGGFIYRGIVGGLPARFSLSYIREFNNGVSSTGLESPQLQGGDFGFTVRLGCIGAVCIRNTEDFVAGAVKTQGNPLCDGAYGGPITCQRQPALGGGVNVSVVLEFPRKRGHESDVF